MLETFLQALQMMIAVGKLFELFVLATGEWQGGDYHPMDGSGTNRKLVVKPARDTSSSSLSYQKDSEQKTFSCNHHEKVITPLNPNFPTVNGMMFNNHV